MFRRSQVSGGSSAREHARQGRDVRVMRTLAQEWGRFRVNVNAVAFGVIDRFGLPQSEHEVIETGGRTIHVGRPAKQAERMGVTLDPTASYPMKRCTRPDRCHRRHPARPYRHDQRCRQHDLLACSPLSDYVTGQVLAVNGGARGGMS